MKKISFEELKDKDLYLDDDGKIIVKNKKVKKKFIPYIIEQIYYYVDCNYSIKEYVANNTMLDICIRNGYSVFETKEEAEEYAKYLKALEKYRYNFSTDEIKNVNIDKFFVEYHIDKDKVISQYYRYYVTNKILFKTKNDCENFIKEVGEENIKKFMFDIWE